VGSARRIIKPVLVKNERSLGNKKVKSLAGGQEREGGRGGA